MKPLFTACITLLLLHKSVAQYRDHVFNPKIKSVKFHTYGNQLALPVMNLGGSDQLELHFDDLDLSYKSYYYTFQLCNADWTPGLVNQFSYMKGFNMVRMFTFRNSSIALTPYIHYQAILPDRNCIPTKSGNYVLKVFLDGDTSKLVILRRFLVVDSKVSVSAQVQQPFNGQYFRSHQKIQFNVNLDKLTTSLPQTQVKVYILQNNRWDNAISNLQPTFVRQKLLEYNTENDCIFPAGKEWRWLDLRSFRFQSDRVLKAEYGKKGTSLFLQPDPSRAGQRYVFFRDLNGLYSVENSESINPFWQSDYGEVLFSYFPPGNLAYTDKDVYVFGELTQYATGDTMKMTFNAQRGCYEKTLFLKQGFYSYNYATITRNDPKAKISFDETEGNYWETENQYTILVYYKELGGRVEELVGVYNFNSIFGRPGLR
jgi:Domain of unknown function (DUF5103)